MLIDCDACAVRGAACAGCMMSAVLDAPAAVGRLDPAEHRAIEAFARAGFEVDVIEAPPARRAVRLVAGGSRRRIA
jgi:hypothetical protein